MATKNPLYPGYYPGEKIPPERGGGGGRREFSQPPGPDAVENFLNALDESNFSFLNMPKWVWEQEKNAIELAWKANYYGDEIISPTEAAVGGQEEIEDLPGKAAAGINLNPVDWVRSPQEQIKDAIVDPISSVIDKDDFLQKTKVEVWSKELLNKDEVRGVRNPFYLPDDTVLETDGKARPLYREVKNKVPEYFGNSNNFFFRNSNLDSVNKETLKALDNELTAKRRYFDDAATRDVVDSFREKVKAVDVFEGLGVVNGVGGGKEDIRINGIGVRTKGTKFNLEELKDLGLDPNNVADLFGGNKEVNVTNITKSLKNITDEYDKKFFRAKGSDVKSHINGLNISLLHAEETLKGIDGAEGLKSYVENLKRVINKHTVVENGVLMVKEGSDNKLFRELKTQKGRLYRKTVDGGVLGGYVRNVVNKEVKDGNSALNKLITSATYSDGSSLMSDESKKLHHIFGNISADWKRHTSTDLAKSLAKGELPSSFIYQNIIQPRIEHYTPSYWINRGLKRVHHFGFITNKDLLGDDPKIPSNRIAKFIESTPLVKDHKFDFVASGEKLIIKAGKHLEPFKELQKISLGSEFVFDISKLSGGDFIGMLNSSGLADLKRSFGLSEEVAKKLVKVKDVLKNRETLRKALGVAVDKDGKFSLTAPDRFKKFFGMFSGDNLRDIVGIDPTISKIGLMQQYSLFLSRIRERAYKSKLGKLILKRAAYLQAGRELLVKRISQFISKAFVVLSDGLGIVVEWAVRIAVEYALQKLQKAFKKWWKALRKLDFTDIVDDLEDAFRKIGRRYLWGCSIGCGIPLALILMLFTVIFTTFSSFSAGRIGQDAIGSGSLFTRDTFIANCGDEVENPSDVIGKNTQGGVAGKAYDLVEDLERGFWCYFNHHPGYDDDSDPVDLFDEQRYSVDPNISASAARQIWNLLFWCTYLPDKAGANIPKAKEYCDGSWATADGMQSCYQNKPGTIKKGFAQYPHYVSGEDAFVEAGRGRDANRQNIFPGDVIFIKSGSSPRTSNHVGVVYDVTPDYVITVQSNTGMKVWSYPVDDDGSILGLHSHEIVGFGR